MRRLFFFSVAICMLLIFSSFGLPKVEGGFIVTPHVNQNFFNVVFEQGEPVSYDSNLIDLEYQVVIKGVKPYAFRVIHKNSAVATPIFMDLCDGDCDWRPVKTTDGEYVQEMHLYGKSFDGQDNRKYVQKPFRRIHEYEFTIHLLQHLGVDQHLILQLVSTKGHVFNISLSDLHLQTLKP